MAHEVYVKNGKAALAFVGSVPWHGLGNELSTGASIETWKTEAGMDWEIKESPVLFKTPNGQQVYSDQKVLYRGDTNDQLAIVGDSYKVVQPGEVLEFFRDLVDMNGMKLSTAGVLFGGRRFWAMVDTGRAAGALKNDRIVGNLLLTTSCDGTMATNAVFTAVRVVCNNTLKLAMRDTEKADVLKTRVTHRTEFNPLKLKDQLGLIDHAWDSFIGDVKQMASKKISDRDCQKFVYDLIKRPNVDAEHQPYTVARDVQNIMTRIKRGMGQDQAEGTLWGVLNGVTEFCDHEKQSRSVDKTLWNSWFGPTADLKSKAYGRIMDMV